MSWPIDSKLHPNIPNTDAIPRSRLLSLLDEAIDKQLVLLSAPAGYGKSTLVGQWFATLDKSSVYSGWLTLDALETGEKHFLTYFVLAMESAGLPVGDLITGARNGFEGWIKPQVIHNIVSCLNTLDRKFILVLEDYHTAESLAVNEIVMRLLRESASRLCLVIDSRVLPELDALSLMVSGAAIEIPATQLKLTRKETADILDDSVTQGEAQTVFEETEGWMMAVQLAKLQRKTRPEEASLDISSGHFVPLYLTKQVLAGLSEKERSLLLAVSVLSKFNASIAAHVSGEADSTSLIHQLFVLSPLIVSLDSQGSWYRLHHLFASYLSELLAEDPDKLTQVLIRASEWHAQQEEIVPAIRYASDAHAYDLCHQIIADAGGWRIILSSGIGILRAALRTLPDKQIDTNAKTLIAKAYLHCKDGEIPEARAALERSWALSEVKEPSLEIDRLAIEAMINLYEDRQSITDVFADLKMRYFDAGNLPPLEQATFAAGETVNQIALADFSAAGTALQLAFESMRESGSVLGLNYCYLHAAHLALYQGDMDLARATIRRAMAMAEENFGSDSGLKNLAQLIHFSGLAWSGTLTEEMLPSFESVLIHAMEFDGWTDICILGLDAFVLVAMRFHIQARALSMLKRIQSQAGLINLHRLCLHVNAMIDFLMLSDLSVGGQSILDGSHSSAHRRTYKENEALSDGSRDWIERVKAVSILSFNSDSLSWQAEFDRVETFLENSDLFLQKILFDVIKAWRHYEADNSELAKTVLFDAVKLAASQKIMGPFLISGALLSLLDQLKSEYRRSDKNFIEYSFVVDILEHASYQGASRDQNILSEREADVICILAQGKSNKEIARDLELTENTVKFHLKQIFSKLGVGKRTQAIIEAKKLGLVD